MSHLIGNYPVFLQERGDAMSVVIAKCGDEVSGGFICPYCEMCLACCHCESSKRDYIHEYHDVQK